MPTDVAPGVYRLAFEDAGRQAIHHPGGDLWFSFDPDTGAFTKVWEGEMEWRGKVYDFSQDNSRAKGEVLMERPREIVITPSFTTAEPRDGGWRFKEGNRIVFQQLRLEGWAKLFIGYEHTSRKGPLVFELRGANNKLEQWFGSAQHVNDDNAWQWNFKEIVPRGMYNLIVRQEGDYNKKLRNLRIYGQQHAWFDGLDPCEIRWKGYSVSADGRRAEFRIEADGQPITQSFAWDETELRLTIQHRGTKPLLFHPMRDAGAERFNLPRSFGTQVRPGTTTVEWRRPLQASVEQDPPSTIAGITVWAWEIGDRLNRRPMMQQAQTPNHYQNHKQIDFNEKLDTEYGPLTDGFFGEVRGWLKVDQPGRYRFRLTCDDGAALSLDGATICDTEDGGENFTVEGATTLTAGLKELRLPFYEDQGRFYLRLEWMKPGDTAFSLVPEANLRTEPGQTFVTSPGPKRWFYGEDPRAPGDGRPLEAPHPAMTLENFRGPDFEPAVGALHFLPDGRLAVATWDEEGAVYLLDNLDDEVTIHQYARGLGEPLGLLWHKGDLYVTQKQEVTRLRDTDGDGVVDRFDAVAEGWPASHNYHEFTFNLVPWQERLYIATSVPLKSGHTNYMPGSHGSYTASGGPGYIIEIDPESGEWRHFASGMRTPNGMGIGPDGAMYVSDNQGSWLPASPIYRIEKGATYLHQEHPTKHVPTSKPIVWFPHGEIGNSPSEMTTINSGPYKGQMLVGDVTHGGLKRVQIQKVNGQMQGTVFRFAQGLEAGINRVAWGPDGKLYVGGIGSNGNWNHLGRKFGLQRLAWNGDVPFEMKSVKATPTGIEIEFTKDPGSLNADSFQIRQWRYEPTIGYGGPKIGQETLALGGVRQSGNKVHLMLPQMREGHLIYVRMRGVTSADGEEPWSTEAWHTLNEIPR